MKLRALDLFCGAGGATKGLQMAGFHVTGVDIKLQPHYVGDAFIQADAMGVLLDGYDLIWASPPCQAYSIAATSQRNNGKSYPDLLCPTRLRLEETDSYWIIENVPGAPMRADYVLCGCQFGLEIRRKRWFETSWRGFSMMPECQHPYPVVSVVGHGTPSWARSKLGFNPTIADYRKAMSIDWMNRIELSQAIPPAYSEFLGKRVIEYLQLKEATA